MKKPIGSDKSEICIDRVSFVIIFKVFFSSSVNSNDSETRAVFRPVNFKLYSSCFSRWWYTALDEYRRICPLDFTYTEFQSCCRIKGSTFAVRINWWFSGVQFSLRNIVSSRKRAQARPHIRAWTEKCGRYRRNPISMIIFMLSSFLFFSILGNSHSWTKRVSCLWIYPNQFHVIEKKNNTIRVLAPMI